MNLNSLIKQFRWFFDIRGIETDELPNAPVGWRDLLIEYSRSKTYTGLLRTITGQLDFSGKAAFLLRREYAKYRLLARMNFRILEDSRQPYNTYQNIYTGQIDFSKKVDKQGTFTAGAKTLDFSQNIDAYDSQEYAIPLTGGINLELPGIELTENPELIFNVTSDFRSNAFFQITIAQYSQLSVSPSISTDSGFRQTDTPLFDKSNPNFFFISRVGGKIQLQGNISASVNSGRFQFNIYKSDGSLVKTLYETPNLTVTTQQNFNWNFIADIAKDDRLFFYIKRTGGTLNSFQGVQINGPSSLLLNYNTITPPTMCQALRGNQLFAGLLKAMNINQDSGPNLPVSYSSYLLANSLAPLVFSCSDSIRAAQGSIFNAGDTIGPGIYKVITPGPVIYSGTTYTQNQRFTFVQTATTFTGSGAIQKIQSIIVGNVYNIGDSLQAGGTYLVEGLNGGSVIYNSISIPIGGTFKFVLGQDTFTGSDPSMFVKQIAVDPVIIISFADFFQCLKSVQGGDCAFGVTPYVAANNNPDELAKQLTGIPFIETLANVYRAGINQISLGNLSKDWQGECALDMMYNTIDVGQKDQQYDAINGYSEVSSTQSYASALLTPIAKLNLVSPVRFDPYGAETVRITQNDTAASRSDNDTWGFWINTTPVSSTPFEYYRPLGSEGLSQPIVGVPASYYNWMLSPKRNLLRGSRYLASIFYNMPGYQLRLTAYKKNVSMRTVALDGIMVSESDPVEISNLGRPYFIPEYFSDTIPTLPIEFSPYADLNFNINGFNWKAFVVDYKINPATGKPQPVKFLLSPDNDMSRSVR